MFAMNIKKSAQGMWDGDSFELPNKIERCLAALSRIYAQGGQRLLQEIIVNAQTRVAENWSMGEGVWGHALHLVIPETSFLAALKNRDEIQDRIRDDLNELHNVKAECVAAVFLEMDVADDRDWRQESGLLITTSRGVTPEAASSIWSEGTFRLFLRRQKPQSSNPI
jgi:hypothetical protein